MPTPAAEQRVCTEDGVLFVAGRSDQLTCSGKCRTRKSRREAKGLAAPYDAARRGEILADIRAAAEEGAVGIAREIMASEIAPVVREALTPAVLRAIADMVGLAPLMVAGLREELEGAPLRDPDTKQLLRDPRGAVIRAVDPDRRLKAIALLSKYTVGSPALAPQAPPEHAPPIAINFGPVPRPSYGADSTAERVCEICNDPHPEVEFVEGSDRCAGCQAALEATAQTLVAEQAC